MKHEKVQAVQYTITFTQEDVDALVKAINYTIRKEDVDKEVYDLDATLDKFHDELMEMQEEGDDSD